MGMTFWNVYLRGKKIDSVPYNDDCDADYVRRGLIGHDGYDSGIVVRRAPGQGRKTKAKRVVRPGGKARHGRTSKGGAKFVTGDGKRFATMDAAISHANNVFRSTGVVISVEAARAGGGKARHAPERSRLRPFATYCASCHKHISGTEHVWKIAGDKYLCNACGSATGGGGKKRHGKAQWYVGPSVDKGWKWEPFVAARKPTHASHGKKYGYSIGPFRTRGGAAVMARYGAGNPNLQTVSEAEKMAKREKEAGNLDNIIAEVKAMLKK